MKMILIRFGLSLTLIFAISSCSNNSEIKEVEIPEKKEIDKQNQSGWRHEDRLKAIQEMEAIRADLEAVMGDKTDAYIECYLSSLEAEFPDLESINNDPDKVVEISTRCAESVIETE